MKRVLMALYHFPPVGGISMARNLRNVEYLQDAGWQAVVLTPGWVDSAAHDEQAMGDIPEGALITRTGYLEPGDLAPVLRAVRSAKRTVVREKRSLVASGTVGHAPVDAPEPAPSPDPVRAASAPSPAPGATPGGVVASASLAAQIRRLVFFPDNQAGWLPFALVAALRAHRREPVDVVYSTFPPMTSHVVAAAFARITGVPFVCEFRDPWIGNALEPRAPWAVRQLRRKTERWVVRSASRVVAVTPRLAQMLERRYPGLRVDLVPNGYVRGEAAAAPRATSPGAVFRLVYTGTMDRPRDLQAFADGLALALNADPSLGSRLRIDIYGMVSAPCRALLDAAPDAVREVIKVHGFVPRAEAVRAVAEADAALVLLSDGPNMDLFVPGKLYDYLGQDRQVLAMLPDGDARDLLGRLGWGVIARPEPDDVAAAVARLVASPAPEGRADPDGEFDRRQLAARLAAVLDEA